jgi:glucose/arabinose dehydrogenase
VLALRDTDGDGRADRREMAPAGGGGNGIALTADHLYFATDAAILRWAWSPGQLKPAGAAETVVRDLPTNGNHTSKSVAVGPDGSIYVNVGSATNSCQRADRQRRSPGIDPCSELDTRAGIWRFAPDRLNQSQGAGTHYATGLRNTIALAFDPASGLLYGATHGRDQLGDNWGFSDRDNAENPAEEFVQIREGSDFGWPYCYYDPLAKKKVLAPEYGGDGMQVGRCASKQDPLIGFPGHWAPMAIAFYRGSQFPPSYAGGAFIAFHGSWNRAPLRQEGYRVVFAPFKGGTPTGAWETFAILAGRPTGLRPSGLAIGPDGSLYISADGNGKVWRVMKK